MLLWQAVSTDEDFILMKLAFIILIYEVNFIKLLIRGMCHCNYVTW